MKKTLLLIALVLSTTLVFSQKNEKLKGSKIVTLEQKEVEDFDAIEISDDIEVFLVKGDKCSLEIEADDNIHDAMGISVDGTTLRLMRVKKVSSYKKFSVRINYTENLKSVVGKNESKITAIADISLADIKFKLTDESQFFGNIKSKVFSIDATDKCKAEMNIKTEKSSLSFSKNANLKALISSNELIIDMYQKAEGIIEGDAVDFKLRLDNNSEVDAKKLTAQHVTLAMEGYTRTSVNAINTISIEASGKAEIQLFGDQKIEMKRFVDNATLYKKPTK